MVIRRAALGRRDHPRRDRPARTDRTAAQTVNATIVEPLDTSGNVKVHEQGTVSVLNSETGPVVVRDLDSPTHPLQHEFSRRPRTSATTSPSPTTGAW